MKPLFESKEYGIGGHNKLRFERMDDGELRIWIKDGDSNALICMDRADFERFGSAISRHGHSAPDEVACFDFTKPVQRGRRKNKKTLRSKKKRDKVEEMVGDIKDIDEVKARKIAEAM